MMAQSVREAITPSHPIAYFSAEYGFDAAVPIYAGGLGVLSGDTLKQAADDNIPMVGLGLLYRGWGMKQRLDEHGMQIDDDWLYDPVGVGLEHVYLDGLPLFVSVHLGETLVWLRVWKKTFGSSVTLYLLDSETDQNTMAERSITQILYSGSSEYQLKQAMVLGIGGVKVLTALGIHPALYHLNEGRPAFVHWQLIRQYMDFHGMSYESAHAMAKAKTVYTNHTLVGAANLGFSNDLVAHYAHYYATKMKVSNETLLAQGHDGEGESFGITTFALNISKRNNGVSSLHSRLSEEQWPTYHWCNVTNGVHMPTWQSTAIRDNRDNPQELWRLHTEHKQQLAEFVQRETGFSYDSNRLVITWARRLAGYKRLDALFGDIEQFKSLLLNLDRPVQLLVAGKAHQGDWAGKEMLKKVIAFMADELSGHALFIPNYNIAIAQQLTRGSDVWLNTPEIGREACGTSGMKAISNGVLQCTVTDGWAEEVDWSATGWTLDPNNITASVYSRLSTDIIPMYFNRNDQGVPEEWVARMQQSIGLSTKYSAARMMREYAANLYQDQELSSSL